MKNTTLSRVSLTAGQLTQAARIQERIEAIQKDAEAKIGALTRDLERVMGGAAPTHRVNTAPKSAPSAGGYQRNWSAEGLKRLQLGQIMRRQGLAAAQKQARAWGIQYTPKPPKSARAKVPARRNGVLAK
jgi:hypothetical protein